MRQAQGLGALTIEVIRGSAALDTVAPDWPRLAQHGHLFSDLAWLRCWLTTFAQRHEVWIVRARVGRRTVALLPLMADRTRWVGCPVRRLSLCANDHSLWGGPLVDRDGSERTISALASFIASLPDWDLFDLSRIPASDRAGTAFLRAMVTHGPAAITRLEQTYVLDTNGSWDAYAGSLSRNFRSTLGRTRRQLDAMGGLSVCSFGRQEDAEYGFGTFLAVDNASWKREGGEVINGIPALCAHYRRLVHEYMAAGRGWVTVVRAGERPVAAALGFQHGGVAYAMKASCDATVESATLAPGHLAVLGLVEEAFRRRLRTVQFLSGAPSWARYGGELEPVLAARVFHPSRYGRFVAKIDRARGASLLLARSGIG